MFSTLPNCAHTLTTYTPHVSSPLSSSPLRNSPSPLSPRDANLPARDPDLEMPSPTPTSKCSRQSSSKPTSISSPEFHVSETPRSMTSALPSPPPSRGRAGRESVYSKRVTKANPLMNRNADEGREARRKLFLKRVREGGEEKRWRDRHSGIVEGEDEVLRAIWVAEERRREEARRREAVGVLEGVEEEEVNFDEAMADEVAMKEQQELEALLDSLGEPQEEMDAMLWGDQIPARQLHQGQRPSETPYGSDDEEYDHIFMDVIEEENRMVSQQQLPGYLDADHEMMDMS